MSGYVAQETSAFLTSAELPSEEEVEFEEIDLSEYAKTSAIPDVSDMATKTWVGEQGYLTSIPSDYVTETELAAELSVKADTSAIPDVSNFVTQEDIDASVSGKMDASESSAFYPMATNPSGYLVSSDLNGYATESYVTSQTSGKQDTLTFGYTDDKISSINSSAIYSTGGVTERYVQDAIASGTSAFITSAELPSEEEVQFEELDLSGYATESYVDSAVSGKQDTLTFSYDASDKINAINGSALAGGGGISQVNSDWDATSGVAEILNKPDTEEVEFEELETSSFITSADFTLNQSNQITGIDGYAIAGGGGGGHEYSGTNGVYVDNVNEVIGLDTSASNAVQAVIENSGAWGGEGLPISAGPGITISLVSGSIVIGLDTSAVQAMLS
jgi:hypothetical protein